MTWIFIFGDKVVMKRPVSTIGARQALFITHPLERKR
jgi:hypothetical protein